MGALVWKLAQSAANSLYRNPDSGHATDLTEGLLDQEISGLTVTEGGWRQEVVCLSGHETRRRIVKAGSKTKSGF